MYIKTINFVNISGRKTEMFVFDVRRSLKQTTLLLSLKMETMITLTKLAMLVCALGVTSYGFIDFTLLFRGNRLRFHSMPECIVTK